jgi:hypothetical protein
MPRQSGTHRRGNLTGIERYPARVGKIQVPERGGSGLLRQHARLSEASYTMREICVDQLCIEVHSDAEQATDAPVTG